MSKVRVQVILSNVVMRGICLGVLVFWWVTASVSAQNPHVYSQYFMNPYVYNPALAGVEGHSAVFLMYRQQWAGLEGAPQVSHINWHVPLRYSLGIGVHVDNDQVGPLTTTQFKGTVSYLLNLDRTHFFRFGLSLGAGSDGVDYDKIIGEGPVSIRYATELEGFRENSFHLLGDFGAMYHFTRFNIGFSLPYLFGRRSLNEQSLSPISFTPLQHIFFKMNYRHSLFNDAIAVEPHVLYRYNAIGNNQVETSFIVHIAHVVWVGVSYRQPSSLIGLIGFKMFRAVAIGYAYDVTPSDLSAFAGPTHELHMGFHIGSRFDHVEHAHSFIKSHGKKKPVEEEPAEETQVEEPLPGIEESLPGVEEALPGVKEPLPGIEEPLPGVKESLPGVEEALPGVKESLPGVEEALPGVKESLPGVEESLPGVKESLPGVEESLPERQAPKQAPAQNLGDGAFVPIDLGAIAHKGNHIMEMSTGSYVIVGSFSKYDNAERYSEYLLRRGYVARVGYNSERGYFYVDMFYHQDVFAARARRDELRSRAIFANAWVLTVIESK